MTTYKNTKNGKLFTLVGQENGKFQIEDVETKETKEVSESTMKRWYKQQAQPVAPSVKTPVKKEKVQKTTPKAPSTKQETGRGRKRNPESIESFCLDLLKEGGTIQDMANKLEVILTEKGIKFTDCKMRMRRAVYYAEQETGMKVQKDKDGGRGKTTYKLV